MTSVSWALISEPSPSLCRRWKGSKEEREAATCSPAQVESSRAAAWSWGFCPGAGDGAHSQCAIPDEAQVSGCVLFPLLLTSPSFLSP